MTASATTPRTRPIGLLLLVAVVAGLVVAFITYEVFGGSPDAFSKNLTATPDYLNLILVNGLVGVSVALFIWQLRWNALRVILTVAIALVLGYFVTGLFNLDAGNQGGKGEFRATVISKAEPIEEDGLELSYGQARGGDFNKEGAKTPLTEARYRFKGRKDDVVTILAYAANQRSQVDVGAALLDEQGVQLAAATTATAEQIAANRGKLRTERDAIIQDFTLPADGVYTVYIKPESPPFGQALNAVVTATNESYQAFLLGPLGRPNRWAVWIQDALTLILVGLAISIVFRARQFSLGAEGQLYLGALASGAIALATTTWPPLIVLPLALLAGMTAGFLWGLIPGVLKTYLGANELVSTLMLNTIAVRFYDLVLTFQLKPPEAGYIASAPFPASGQLPVFIGETQVTIAVFIVIIAVLAVWLLISRTPLGYEIRVVGSNLKFADYGGINTKRTIMLAMAISGILAGLAGVHLSMGIYRQLLINMSINLAFEGVVVALLARTNPLVVPFTGLLYAYLRAGAQFMERDSNVSFEVVRIIQAVIILLITAEALIAFWQNRRLQRAAVAASETQPHDQPVEARAS